MSMIIERRSGQISMGIVDRLVRKEGRKLIFITIVGGRTNFLLPSRFFWMV